MGLDSAHAPFPPSGAERWMTCHASWKAGKLLAIEQEEKVQALADKEGVTIEKAQRELEKLNTYAFEGTICHEVAANCLRDNKQAEEYRGQVIEGVAITDELTEAIQLYIDEVRGLSVELGTKGGKIEHRVHITDDCFGTVDALLWNDDVVVVADAKFGRGVLVSVDHNKQLMTYAVGALMWLQQEQGVTPERVVICIIQARVTDPVRKWETTRETIIEFYKDVLVPSIAACKANNPQFVAGEEICRWCPVEACKAKIGLAAKKAEDAFAVFKPTAPAFIIPSEPPSLEEPELSLEQLADVFSYKGMVVKVFNEIGEYLTAKALKGETIPGYKLIEGRSSRVWENETEAVAYLKECGITATKEVILTAPALEKTIGKKKAKEIKLDKFIYKPKGAPVLALESSKKPAITLEVDAEAAMAEVTGIATGGNPDVVMKNGSTITLTDSPKKDAPIKSASGGFMSSIFSMPSEEEEALPSEADFLSDTPEERIVMEEQPVRGVPSPPQKSTKRWSVISVGLEGIVSFESVAEQLSTSANQIERMVRWAHTRDGYGFRIYSDATFDIQES